MKYKPSNKFARSKIIDTIILDQPFYEDLLEECIKDRKELKLSSREVSDMLHISHGTLANIEKKHTKKYALLIAYRTVLDKYKERAIKEGLI